MTLRDSTYLLRKLNPHCASALADAASLCNARLHGEIMPEHWLLKLIEFLARHDTGSPANFSADDLVATAL